MECLDNLSKVFAEFEKTTKNLKALVPSLNESITESLKSVLAPPQTKSDDEVYAGLPSVINSRPLFNILALCTPRFDPLSFDKRPKVPHRQILARLELVALVAGVYEQNTTELSTWQAIETFSHQTKRVIDEVYALANRAFVKLRIAEQTFYSDREQLVHKVDRIKNALRSKSALFTEFESLVTCTKMPTAHASLQCLVSDSLLAYIYNYNDWFAARSRLEMMLIRHKEFLENKSWAAVYCRAFLNWLMLRARLYSGSPPSLLEEGPEPAISLLYAAANIKLHARTLLKFTLSHLYQKNGNKNTPLGQTSVVETDVPAPEMVNLWLGARLLFEGSLQVAELHTLLGSVKEARFYQLELLRVAQHFHSPAYAQSALCMMAYTDLLSQRVWAFDLRLTQLSYILNSPVLLEEIVKSRESHKKTKPVSGVDGVNEDDEESNFLRQRKKNSPNADDVSDDDERFSGVARNPIINAQAGGLPELMHVSPVKGAATMNSPNGFPSIESIAHAISGNKEPKTIEEEGVYSSYLCAHRILNGSIWLWMSEISNFVRTMLTSRDHLFPVLIPPSKAGLEMEEELSHALESKCIISPKKAPFTPAQPITKAARAALVGRSARKSRISPEEQGDAPKSGILKSVHAPKAPRRLFGQWLDGDIAALPRRNRRVRFSKTASMDLSAPEDSREDWTEKGDEALSTHRLSVLRAARNPQPPFLFRQYGSTKSGFVFGKESQTGLRIFQDINGQKTFPKSTTSPPESKRPDGIKPPQKASSDISRESDNSENVKPEDAVEEEEPVESCPALAYREPLPENTRLTAKYFLQSHQPRVGLDTTPSLQDPSETLIQAQKAFAERLYSIYTTLAVLPVPHLMRPICQWLGLRLLSRGDQTQAARYFAQAVGNGACSLFTSMLSSKLRIAEIAQSLRVTYAVSAPYDSSKYLTMNWKETPPVNVVQFMLVDEMGLIKSFDDCDENGSQAATDLIIGGLGSRKQVHLVATRWFLGEENACIESRVMHQFSVVGQRYMRDFEDLQKQNNASMLEVDRRQFWAQRFSLDVQLKNLIDGIRNDCFTTDDLEWIRKPADSQTSLYDRPTILILDRQLTLLPWEWIIWGQTWNEEESKCCVPAVCRNFALSLLVGHQSLKKTNAVRFDSDSVFYVVNPEANLSNTEEIFKNYFTQNFPKWNGILGRMPQPQEVIEGFVEKDLFVYLGHGNGSKCLMPTFDEGVTSKAVAFIIGCSSGRPRIEGRHEAYASVFNHLISGAPTAVSLMWDVTDKDIDRFTQNFLDIWIRRKEEVSDVEGEEEESTLSMTWKIFKASRACKLQSLVGKSVIVYGLPALPARKRTTTEERPI
ncbi:hypothetical protein Aperf_G00000005776 [Anoplocephala perfoliata]